MMAVTIRREGNLVCVIGGTQVVLPAEVLDELLGTWFRDYAGREHTLLALPPGVKLEGAMGRYIELRLGNKPHMEPNARLDCLQHLAGLAQAEVGHERVIEYVPDRATPWMIYGLTAAPVPCGNEGAALRLAGFDPREVCRLAIRRLSEPPKPTAERLVWPEKARQVAGCRSPSYERHVCGACGCSVADDRKACPECGRTFRGDKMMGQEGLVSQGLDAVICSPCAYAHVPQSACKCLDCGRTVRGDKMMVREGGEDG